MRLPRVRFTMRRMMVAVAILGAVLAYAERWQRYRRLGAYHLKQATAKTWSIPQADGSGYYLMPDDKVAIKHFERADEYNRAAIFPWVRVAPEGPPAGPW
jgi:hypothetical protein